MGYFVQEVSTPKEVKEFLEVNVLLNKNNPNYIRPLNKDILDVFNPKKNKTYRFGRVIQWILKNEKNEPVGRIAAFTNKKYKNKGDSVPVGGIGFFDSINDQAAADILLNTAKNWLEQQGMQAMDGPINFGERDRWWGLLVKGFQPPLYCMNYNPPYYQTLFETFGFMPFFYQICFGKHPKQKLSDKTLLRHAIFERDPHFEVRTIKKKELEKYAFDFASVYNAAWAGHGGLKELKKEQVMLMFNKMKPVMDEKIIWFAYYKNEPIAIFVNLPDLNQWFKHLNGKFDTFHKLYFLFLKQFKKNKKFTGLVFGIVPEWQGKGVDSFIIGESAKHIQSDNSPYTEYEMQWIGDFNPRMINIGEGLGDVSRSRNLTTYRYIFDRSREFKRHPLLS